MPINKGNGVNVLEKEFFITPLDPSEENIVLQLLTAADLPIADLNSSKLSKFLVAKHEQGSLNMFCPSGSSIRLLWPGSWIRKPKNFRISLNSV
jgi:hypothetical protein